MIALLLAFAAQDACPMTTRTKSLYCDPCEEFVDRKAHDGCAGKPARVDCCEWIVFACPTCGLRALKDGACATEECAGAELDAVKVSARILWGCEGSCGTRTERKKKCDAEGCTAKGKSFVQACERSGEWPHTAEPADVDPTFAARRELDKIVRAFDAEDGGFCGCVLVAAKGRILLEQGFGTADRANDTPMAADALWDWASVSKQFTAAAVLKLQDQKKLSLDDPISKYYQDAPEDKAAVTLRQLLNHTSGIQAGFRGEWEFDSSNRESFERMMMGLPMESKPGEAWEYSNSGYALAAAVVERVSEKSFEKFCIDELFKPAGMKDAAFIGRAELDLTRVPKVHRGEGFGGGRAKFAFAYGDRMSWGYRGCGGAVATLRDMYAWDRALRGDGVLSAAAREEYYKAGLKDYALGWFVTGRGRVEHAGGVEGVIANYVRLLEADVVVALVCSYEPKGDFRRLTEDLIEVARRFEP